MTILETGANPSYVLISPNFFSRPRFWSTVWTLSITGRGWAENTLKTRLRNIDRFYEHCDKKFGMNALDCALGDANAPLVHCMVDDFYIELTSNEKYTTTDVQCWDDVRTFVLHFGRYWSVGSDEWRAFVGAMKGTGRLRSPKRGRIKFARALPEITLSELLEVAQPGSTRNPFVSPAIQQRNWLALLLMLLCGLRRGEALLLTVDSLRQGIDQHSGEIKYWLDVISTGDDDIRTTRPSIKTSESNRQIPLSADLAILIEQYIAEYREDDEKHRFLLTSDEGKALSAESINKVLVGLSKAISSSALERFKERTGGKKHISPHDLRHTCATVRYGLFMAVDSNRDLAMQRMRAFFGWAIESDMPLIYARAAIQEDLLKSWSDLFDQRVSAMRGKQ